MLIQSEFYLSAAVTKWYQCKQKDVRKIVENSALHVPSRVRPSERNRQAAEQESYPGEIELENKGINES